jgi:formate hydrogenlyase subunit 6/NADH:ubiquinone oxidoreductase subunit I
LPTTIYYFSGSGNSLAVSRSLSRELEDSELVPMARLWKLDRIVSPAGTIGFVFPMYFYGLPDIVERFLTKIELDRADYLFAVVTRAGAAGCSLQKTEDILSATCSDHGKGSKRKGSNGLDAGFYVDMPSNYTPIREALPKEKQEKIFKAAEKKITKIARTIRQKRVKGEKDKPLVRKVAMGNNETFLEEVHRKDEDFHVDRTCISCGFCARICPVDNILMVAGRPQWQHHCQHCLACLHFCPKESIQFTRKTVGRKRYHHPDVTFKDIESQKWKVVSKKIHTKKAPSKDRDKERPRNLIERENGSNGEEGQRAAV